MSECDDVFIVPAGGLGTRLWPLTKRQAKPSLPVSFEGGEVKRLIDIPLGVVKRMGGMAVVTTCYMPDSLEFVDTYPHVVTAHEDSPIPYVLSLRQHRNLFEKSERTWILPGDANVTAEQLESMRDAATTGGYDGVVLATRHTAGHNTWEVDVANNLTPNPGAGDRLADLGVHVMHTTWLIEQLRYPGASEIWDLYPPANPRGAINLHVPEEDVPAIDLGTPSSYAAFIRGRVQAADDNENIIFPRAVVTQGCQNVIALPDSTCMGSHRFNNVIFPEGTVVSKDDVVQL